MTLNCEWEIPEIYVKNIETQKSQKVANWYKSEFIESDGMIRITDKVGSTFIHNNPLNVNHSIANKLIKLFNADPDTIKQYTGSMFSNNADYYHDKNNIFYHPINWEWNKLEMNIAALKKIDNSRYLKDDNSYFYDNWIYGINKLDTALNKDNIIKYLWHELMWINDILYYIWKNQSVLDLDTKNIQINETWAYITSNNRIFFLNFWKLTEIKWVDLSTFTKIDNSTYQDKNNTYKIIQWHYGFDIETESWKLQTDK